MNDVRKLSKEIIDGRRLTPAEDVTSLIYADLEELMTGADDIRKALVGNKVDLCTIISGVSGRCSEDCKFCAQSAHHDSSCDVHGLLREMTIFTQAKSNQDEGVDRFSIVDSGRTPNNDDFEKILAIYKRMNEELDIHLCASLGFLSEEQWRKLHAVGVTGAHINIETSRNFFPKICTTHSFDDKLGNIKNAKAAGLNICSGGIIGMGESWQDRIDMAFTLAELEVSSIPINSLMPIEGTPLENMERLSEDDILRTIAIFRYIVPESNIRLAGGRALMKDDGREAFSAGASASITGNMLTTSGSTIKSDRSMLESLGRDVTPEWADK